METRILKKPWWKKTDFYIGLGFNLLLLAIINIVPKFNEFEIAAPLFWLYSIVLSIVSVIIRRGMIFVGYLFGFAIVSLFFNEIFLKFFWK